MKTFFCNFSSEKVVWDKMRDSLDEIVKSFIKNPDSRTAVNIIQYWIVIICEWESYLFNLMIRSLKFKPKVRTASATLTILKVFWMDPTFLEQTPGFILIFRDRNVPARLLGRDTRTGLFPSKALIPKFLPNIVEISRPGLIPDRMIVIQLAFST